jgi:hypothetical protein
MYQLMTMLTVRQVLARQVPALVVSFLVAEIFYKFHSFTLECAAFLVTWFVVDTAFQFVARSLQWTWATDSKNQETQAA